VEAVCIQQGEMLEVKIGVKNTETLKIGVKNTETPDKLYEEYGWKDFC
jgi:hypothetical protein